MHWLQGNTESGFQYFDTTCQRSGERLFSKIVQKVHKNQHSQKLVHIQSSLIRYKLLLVFSRE